MNIGLVGEALDMLFILLGKTGKILNARGIKICFIIDSICLVYWFYIDIDRHLYSQAANAFMSLCINIYGWRVWTKKGIK